MLPRKITLICLLFSGLMLHAQTKEIDSLKLAFNLGKGVAPERRILLNQVIVALVGRLEMDSAAVYGRRFIEFLPPPSDSPRETDSITIADLCGLGAAYQFYHLDSAIGLSTRALTAARRSRSASLEAWALCTLGENYRLNGEPFKALDRLTEALRISRQIHNEQLTASLLVFIGAAYSDLEEYRLGLDHLFEGLAKKDQFAYAGLHPFLLSNIGYGYMKLNMLDSALYFASGAQWLIDR
jgi:tetratricopeptide (TPR) repeat protein